MTPKAALIWGAVVIAIGVPMALAATSDLIEYRGPIYIVAGFAGMIALGLLLVQPLLIGGYLPGPTAYRARRAHHWIGGAILALVLIHVAGLWITSPPDMIDALTFTSPTPFSPFGVIAMWAIVAVALLALVRRRLGLRTWRIVHMSLAAVIVVGSVAHGLLIEGTMETISKAALCVLVVAAAIKVIVDLVRRMRATSRALLLVFLCVLLLAPGRSFAGVKEDVAALAPSGLVLVTDESGNELVAQNADAPFVPASVTKIVTAWLALDVLGDDYRFTTRFYLDRNRVLYIRGSGDPFLVSEELSLLAAKLTAVIGKKPLNGIVIDASYYPSDLHMPGIEDTAESYDALNAALAVNFNTISAIRKGDTVRSADKLTPITPLAISLFRKRGPQGRGRISLGQDPAVGLQYAGELTAAFIKRAGGTVKGKISTGAVPEGLEPIYVHQQSRTLSKILAELLLGSNNFVANQVFLEIGAHRLGGPVSLEKSLKVANDMLAEHGLGEAIHLEEGSGISRGNTFTARGLTQLLHDFEPHAGLLRKGDGASFKTGTFSGVSTLAGYANTSKHGRVRFVISLTNNDNTMRFRLLKAIQAGL